MPDEVATPELVSRLVAREEGALGLLYERLGPPLRGMVARILTSQEEVEDVVENSFLELWKQTAQKTSVKASVEVWLTLAARDLAVERLRAARKSPRRKLSPPSLDSAWLPDSSEFALFARRRELVRNALGVLPASQRAVLDLAVYRGRTEEEMADLLHKPLGRLRDELRATLRYVRQRLHALMGTWTANI